MRRRKMAGKRNNSQAGEEGESQDEGTCNREQMMRQYYKNRKRKIVGFVLPWGKNAKRKGLKKKQNFLLNGLTTQKGQKQQKSKKI